MLALFCQSIHAAPPGPPTTTDWTQLFVIGGPLGFMLLVFVKAFRDMVYKIIPTGFRDLRRELGETRSIIVEVAQAAWRIEQDISKRSPKPRKPRTKKPPAKPAPKKRKKPD